MKKFFVPILVALASLPLTSIAQSENPRGIYKMMTLTGKQGEIPSPFDQYKICTDSISLTLNVIGNLFLISNKENIFYTGNQPIPADSKSMLIYDSNAEHFTLKWWSTHLNNPYFPENDWCIEKYESNKYSKIGKILFDALNGKAETSISNPLIGTWQIIGMVEEPQKKKIKQLYKDRQADTNNRRPNSYLILTPNYDISMFEKSGMVGNVEYDGKEALKKGTQTRQVKWLSKNRIALETRTNFNAGWQILERVTDGQTMMSRIMHAYLP